MNTETPESLYSRAALLAADPGLAAALDGLKQLCTGWKESTSPAPVHRLLSEKLAVPEGRKHHQAVYLQLAKVDTEEGKLNVSHARLWQFLSLRFFPANPAGLMQFQAELAVILEALAKKGLGIKAGDLVRQYAVGDSRPIAPCNRVLVVYADNGEIEIEGDGIPMWRADGSRIDGAPFAIAVCDGKNCLNAAHRPKPQLKLV